MSSLKLTVFKFCLLFSCINGTAGVNFVSTGAGVACTETPPNAHAHLIFSIASLIVVAPLRYRYKWDGTQQLKTAKFSSAL